MNLKVSRPWLWLTGALAAVSLVHIGCSTDSAEGIVRTVDIIVEGFYTHPNAGSTLVANTSGAPVTSFNVNQSGDELQVFDNNGILFRGTLGRVAEGTVASFNLSGQTTGGESVTIAGNIAVDGTTATMRGTWLEPTLSSTVFGEATVPTNPAPPVVTNDTAVTLNQTLVSLDTTGTTTFSATGGTGSYTWSVRNSGIGNITSISGTGNSSATYSANGNGTQTVTVTDTAGDSASATVQQSSSGGSVTDVTLDQTLVTVDADGGSTSFTASGGTGNFTWSVSNRGLGSISAISGARNANAAYTAVTEGQNTVTVQDAAGGSASATVIQQFGGGIVFPPAP